LEINRTSGLDGWHATSIAEGSHSSVDSTGENAPIAPSIIEPAANANKSGRKTLTAWFSAAPGRI
jgi:hypothetical protein